MSSRGLRARCCAALVAATALGLLGLVAGACGSFSGDDPASSADATTDTGSGGDTAPPDTAPPVRCVPQPFVVDAGPEDASCEPGSAPVDLEISSKHCGRCGHDCLGACSGGRCVVKDVTNDDDGAPQLTASADGSLFYSAGTHVRAFSAAGVAKTLATLADGGYVGAPVRGGDELFFSILGTGIVRLPVNGGTPTTVVGTTSNDLGNIAADGANLYYSNLNNNTLTAKPRNGSDGFVIQASSGALIEGVTADGSHLFWASRGVTTTLKVRGQGANDSAIDRAMGLPPIVALAFDADYIYFISPEGELRRVTKAGLTPPEVIGKITGTRKISKGMAVDADNVYVACSADANGGTVELDLYRVSKCGGPMELITSESIWAHGLVVSGPFLYWGHPTAVARIAK